MNRRTSAIVASMLLAIALPPTPGLAQFSPGPLSSAHAALEGPTNCTKCHDVGKEIAGAKCLDCHADIRSAITRGSGYHGSSNANTACVVCHKEHLGADARTYIFEPATFDHDLTGFSLFGKHSPLACERCHTAKYVRDAEAKAAAAKSSRQSYLGLGSRCSDCHADVHRGSFGPECSSCHTPAGWRDLRSFDHARTKYPLTGKHSAITCEGCHKAVEGSGSKKFAPIAPAAYADCTPCHAGPHRAGLVQGACADCHETGAWALAMQKPFPHQRTKYPLEGRHAKLLCASCHPADTGKSYAETFRRPSGRCIDCHRDRHAGVFLPVYANDCARCHALSGYAPSTFTPAMHQASRWQLTGSHRAVACARCHAKEASGAPWTFRWESMRCETCHEDVHRGQFAAQMGQGGCASCHTTDGWKKAAFAHGTLTAFPLEGKHASAPCQGCHKEAVAQPPGRQAYAKLDRACESCHRDEHRGQFASAGKTDCARCHAAAGWKPSAFDHETQSVFRLTGAHAKVPCAECHRPETSGSGTFARYKPVSPACESCHQEKETR